MVAAGSLEPGYQLIVAHDALARYCIFAIGRRRFAVDWMTGITKLLPGKGNPSVPVIPFPNPGMNMLLRPFLGLVRKLL
jgi:hypothetical protein